MQVLPVRAAGRQFRDPAEIAGADANVLIPAEAHHEGMRIRWEMAPAAGGDAVSGGAQFLLLDADGHIRFDYQFTDF